MSEKPVDTRTIIVPSVGVEIGQVRGTNGAWWTTLMRPLTPRYDFSARRLIPAGVDVVPAYVVPTLEFAPAPRARKRKRSPR